MAIPAGPQARPVALIEGVGKPTFTYTDPTGEVWDLSDVDPDAGWFTKNGIKGWGATNYTLTLDKRPTGGVNVRNIHAEEARLTWPIYIYGDTHLEWMTRYRALRRAFMMTVWRKKAGVLRVTRPDGTAREVDVLYESGFGGEGGFDDLLSSNPTLTLLCPDGYWRDVKPVTFERRFQAGQRSYFAPYPSVSNAQVLGETYLENVGDVDAWPESVITGPATEITAANYTTSQTFTLTRTIAAGELIRITTNRPTVRGPNDINLINDLNWPTAQLWGMAPGINHVDFIVAGADVGTAIEMTFYPRYDGA